MATWSTSSDNRCPESHESYEVIHTCSGSKHMLHSENLERSSSQFGQGHCAACPSSDESRVGGWTRDRDLSGKKIKQYDLQIQKSFFSIDRENDPLKI